MGRGTNPSVVFQIGMSAISLGDANEATFSINVAVTLVEQSLNIPET